MKIFLSIDTDNNFPIKPSKLFWDSRNKFTEFKIMSAISFMSLIFEFFIYSKLLDIFRAFFTEFGLIIILLILMIIRPVAIFKS